MTALLSEISIFWAGAVGKNRLVSYGSKHALQPLFNWDFCVLILVTQKLQVACGHFTYRMAALLLEMSIFCIRAGCQIQLASYGSTTHHGIFTVSHLYILTCITWNYRSCFAYYMTAPLSEEFLVWFKFALEIWLEGYGPDMHQSFCDTTLLCVYWKPIHTSLFGTWVCLTTKLTYLMTA